MKKIQNKQYAYELTVSLIRISKYGMWTKLNPYFASENLDIDPLGFSYSKIFLRVCDCIYTFALESSGKVWLEQEEYPEEDSGYAYSQFTSDYVVKVNSSL